MITSTRNTTTTTTSTTSTSKFLLNNNKKKNNLFNNNNNKLNNLTTRQQQQQQQYDYFDLESITTSDIIDNNNNNNNNFGTTKSNKLILKPPNKLKPIETFVSDNNIIDSSESQIGTNQTNILFIKQKYKMYLDWLNDNNNNNNNNNNNLAPKLPQQQQQQQNQQQQYNKNLNNNFFNNISNSKNSSSVLSTTNIDISNLNWYRYETQILNNEENKYKFKQLEVQSSPQRLPKNDYFTNITNKTHRAQTQTQTTQLPQILTSLTRTKSNLNKKLSPLPSKQSKPIAQSTSTRSINNNKKIDINIISATDSSNHHNNNNDDISLSSFNYDENYIDCQNINNSKAVKFDSNLCLETNTSTNGKKRYIKFSNKHKLQPLKPILKTSVNNSHNELVNKRIIQNSSNSPPSTATSAPLSENSTNGFNDYNTRVQLQKNILFKLPLLTDVIKQKQIPNCSDDFLAVVNDLENNRLV